MSKLMNSDVLPQEIHDHIAELSERGNVEFENSSTSAAIALWEEAYNLLPVPKSDWEAAEWLCVSLGDAYREERNSAKALTYYQEALSSGDGNKNPYILLQLGKSLWDEGYKADGVSYLQKAYMTEGADIFYDDPSYLKLIR